MLPYKNPKFPSPPSRVSALIFFFATTFARLIFLVPDSQNWSQIWPVFLQYPNPDSMYTYAHVGFRKKGCITCRNMPQILGLKRRCGLYSRTSFLRGYFKKTHRLKFTLSYVAFSKCVPNLRETLTYQPIHMYKDCMIIYFHL